MLFHYAKVLLKIWSIYLKFTGRPYYEQVPLTRGPWERTSKCGDKKSFKLVAKVGGSLSSLITGKQKNERAFGHLAHSGPTPLHRFKLSVQAGIFSKQNKDLQVQVILLAGKV